MKKVPEASFRDILSPLLTARFPVLYIQSYEEERVLDEIRAVVADQARVRTPRPVWVWTLTHGLSDPSGALIPQTANPELALAWIAQREEPGVFVLLDLHPFFGDTHRPPEPVVVRWIRNLSSQFQRGPSARVLILVSPLMHIPAELEKDVTIVDFALPAKEDIRSVLRQMIETNFATGRIHVSLDEDGFERLVTAALGLTLTEATNAFARAMVESGTLTADDARIVLEEKRQMIRKSGLLEFVPMERGLADVGGLQNLKRWLSKRETSWLAEAQHYGLPAPKGILITGVPGCGKSLTAKAVAAAWGLPLLRLDVGRVFSSLVGSSEQNLRRAIQAAEATAPCLLWIDEIEKGFAEASGSHDSGTSARVFGSFLTWMQEKTSPVFVIATANRVETVPAEFLRKGRFDEIFFVDLPTVAEREHIWSLHLRAKLQGEAAAILSITAPLLRRLAEASEGYSGAEIEQAVVAAMYDAFAEQRAVGEADLFQALLAMVPLSVTQAEQIDAVRIWAQNRAVAATAPEDRTGYRFGVDLTSALGKNHPPDDDPEFFRGGRTVDF